MYSTDVAFAGVEVAVPLNLGSRPAVGFRIVPVLGVGATAADVRAAYKPLQVKVRKASDSFPNGVEEQHYVAGPDWHATSGFGSLKISAGLNGTTYRVWVATDCKELEFVDTPYYEGFDAGGALAGGALDAAVVTTHAAALGTKPAAAGDGVSLAGAKAIRVSMKPNTAGANFTVPAGPAFLEAYYRVENGLNEWCRAPDFDLQQVNAAALAADEPYAWAPFEVRLPAGARIGWRTNGIAVSAGNVNVRIERYA